MTLKFIEPGEARPTLNILLYGPPGTGKSVAACSAPGPVLVLNAEGKGALRFARSMFGDAVREVAFQGPETLDEAFLYLKESQGGERTVVIDTVGECYRVLLESFGNKRPSLKNYGDTNTKLDRFIRALRDLDLNVVLVAHEQIDDEGGEITRRPATGGKKLPEQVMAQVDVVAYTGVVPETDDTPRRYVGQLVEANGRRAKDRSGALGVVRDLDLTDWITTFVRAMTPSTDGAKRRANSAKTEKKEAVKA
jgi:hypothetical protein